MASSTHTITFSRLRASFTVDKELIGKQDPYVIFSSGSAKAQTKAIKGVGTGTAEWKESYTLEKFTPSQSSTIEVTVYNHNTLLPDSVIGSGTVDLASQGQSSLSGSGEPISVILVDKKGQEVGTLQFITNGGGYSGRGGTTGTGVGSGATGTGVGSGTHGHHHGVGTGAGAAGAGAAGTVVGKGVGSDQATAQHASDKAAREGREVTIEDRNKVGVGHPTTAGTGTGTGTGTHTGTGLGATTGHHHGHHHGHHGAGTTGTGVTGTGVTGTERDTVYGVREGDVIDRKYYTGTEARPQDQALVEQYREHNPYAKDYETTVQHTGRERLVNSQIEALGTRERVIGQDHHVHAHPHTEIARNLPAPGANLQGVDVTAGAVAERPGGEGWVQTKPGPICDTNTFSIQGDRTVDKERVTDLREHREFEKEFEVKTRLVGERALERGTDAEILNRERVLVDEKDKNACEGHPVASAAGGSTLASQGAGTGAGYGSTGSGYGTTGQGQRSTLGEKAAGFIPGTEENKDKKQGYAPGQGPQHTPGNTTAGEKAASFIPGTEENRDKKAGAGSTGYGSTGSGTGYGSTGTGAGYGSQTGTGAGYGSQTGTGAGHGSQTGTGYGSGVGSTGTGYGSQTGTGTGYGGTGQHSSIGEKAAGFIPGSEESRDKKQGYAPGSGPQQTAGNRGVGEKAASFIPGTEENREKKTGGQYA